MDNTSFIQTKYQNCLGCNKCVFICPTGANESFFESDDGKVFIRPGHCISCGECIDICDHDARDYDDDTERFFEDIKNGEKISVVVAPSFNQNFDETNKFFGFLKYIGVNKIYDVSLGADICTWGHVKALKENKVGKIISQPCPVIVSYIEKFEPKLIKYLSPIQSPVISTAIYLKKYVGIDDKIMFLSPCIGKKRECIISETNGALEYNVTFEKFSEYLAENNIDIDGFSPVGFDNMKGSIGFTFPRPGGLCENIKYHMDDDIWIKKIEGIRDIKKYFKDYLEDIENDRAVPDIVDALNCKDGCNLGTGTSKKVRVNEVDFKLNKSVKDVEKDHSEKLMKYFDETLDISDFIRRYVDRSANYKRDESVSLEDAYISLGKYTEEERNINCFSCGYGNCHDFVYDLATGHNDKNNCRHYLLNKFKKISLFDSLTGLKNRYSYDKAILKYTETHSGFIGIAFIDINGLKQVNDVKGHSFGDELIINCASLLESIFGKNVYRIGGDEFVVLENFDNMIAFENKIEKLSNLLLENKDISLSYGTSISRESSDLEAKLEEADKAMYAAKREYYRLKGDRRKDR